MNVLQSEIVPTDNVIWKGIKQSFAIAGVMYVLQGLISTLLFSVTFSDTWWSTLLIFGVMFVNITLSTFIVSRLMKIARPDIYNHSFLFGAALLPLLPFGVMSFYALFVEGIMVHMFIISLYISYLGAVYFCNKNSIVATIKI